MLIVGRMPARGRPDPASAVSALRRERTLTTVRRLALDGRRVAAIHRLRPVARPGRIRGAIRFASMHGALIELTHGERPEPVIDRVARAAGAVSRETRIRPSGDGSALARLTIEGGHRVELRVAQAGHTKDPARGRAALVALAEAGVPNVPRAVAGGITAGAAWSTETVVPGRLVDRLTPGVIDGVLRLCARFPSAAAAGRAEAERLEQIARTFPSERDRLEAVDRAVHRWSSGLGSILVHGDLWRGNILVQDGAVGGLIDWDTWHPSGLPGVDVLGLALAEERAGTGLQLGELFSRDHWRSPGPTALLSRYFAYRSAPMPDAAGLAAIAVAWWAGHVASSIRRGARPATHAEWVRRNLHGPLDRIERLLAELG